MLDDIRKKLEDYEEPEMEGLWEDILPNVKHVRRKPYWKAILIPVAASVCIAASVFFALRRETRPADIIAEAMETVPAPDKPFKETQIQSQKPEIQVTQVTVPMAGHIRTAVPTVSEIQSDEEKGVLETDMPSPSGIPETGREEETSDTPTNDVPYPSWDEDPGTGRKASRLAISLSASNLPGTSNSSTGYSQASLAASPIPTLSIQNGLWEDPIGNIAMKNYGREVRTETTYSPPVRAGISVKYLFPCGIGIESGINYVYLSSRTVSGTDENYFRTEEALHYIGIPVIVSYDIWSNRFVGFYVAAGGAYEKAVYGERSVYYHLDNEERDGSREDIGLRPGQWSVNATAGFQFNILKDFGLYVEPGAGYYFDDGSSLQTIYKSKPWNFYLRFGLRYTISMSRTP